ncbi:DNA repair protein RAD51-1, partial [Galemys pyrenaicus]
CLHLHKCTPRARWLLEAGVYNYRTWARCSDPLAAGVHMSPMLTLKHLLQQHAITVGNETCEESGTTGAGCRGQWRKISLMNSIFPTISSPHSNFERVNGKVIRFFHPPAIDVMMDTCGSACMPSAGSPKSQDTISVTKRYGLSGSDILHNVAYARRFDTDTRASSLPSTSHHGRAQIPLAWFLQMLLQLADEFGVTVVITNQTVDQILTKLLENITVHDSATSLYTRKGKGATRTRNIYNSLDLMMIALLLQLSKLASHMNCVTTQHRSVPRTQTFVRQLEQLAHTNDHYTEFEDTSLNLAHRDSPDATNFGDVLEGQA